MLAGRSAELAEIAALLDRARGGAGGALVIHGLAGAGKSTLLAEAVDSAAGMRVLRTSGVESESPLAFAALQRLLWPLRSRLDALPEPQRVALGAALGEASGHGERFLAFLGTLSLLADAAEDAAVLVVVDDAHWLDDASSAALLFVARRLQTERVALLFAARDGDARRFDAPDLPSLVLDGVAGADADAVLSARSGDIDPRVRDELVAATGGNPLALIELAAVLAPAQLAGRDPLPAQLPLTEGVERRFLDRYRRLSEEAQRWLLVAAADDTARLATVRAAAGSLDAGDDALDEIERAGLVTVHGNALALYHPLVRSAVYQAATSAQRRAAHRALAAAVGDADRRAWHLAAAADAPDDAVVKALDEVAERAAARGGHEAAAAAWSRAAELTLAGEARGRRLYLAASSAWLGGDPSRATALATSAEAELTDPRARAQLLTLEGRMVWNTRSLNDGYDLVLQAAQLAAGVDPALAQELTMLAASLTAFGARSPRVVDLMALVPPPSAGAPLRVQASFQLLRGFRAVAAGDYATAAPAMRSALALTDDELLDDDLLHPNLGIAAMLIDDDEHGLRLHERMLSTARRAGDLHMVEHSLTRGFWPLIATGAWTSAAAGAAEALPLAASTGHHGLTALPLAQLALIAAFRGNADADRLLDEATAIRDRHPVGITDELVQNLISWARALRAAAQPAAALHHFEKVEWAWVRRIAAPDLFDIARRGNEPDMARAWLADLDVFAAGTGNPAAAALVELGRAVLDEDGQAEGHFERALALQATSRRIPDRARTHLAYGEHLRRARRRVDAREHLRSALALFEDLGATPWAERAAQELRASGETARRRDAGSAEGLTAQERQVAALVRRGLSNRDAAAQLFVSPRTVDFHLRNIFTKLGVASRGELIALPLDL